MPTLMQEPLQKTDTSLFIGLQSYTEAQSDIFYGRDEEIDRLTNLVKANTLTIVFGKSGTGKTSLLNAGVFPRLRKDYCLPFRIRLDFQEKSPDLVTQIKNVLHAEIDKYGFKVEAYPSTETLWEYFHREPLWKSVTPILIFDQFEEIFTLGKKATQLDSMQLAAFWEELADLIENSIPEKLREKFLNNKENVGYSYKAQKVKTLFSFREEFLPEFESITAKIPSIKYSRFRLLPMNGAQAYEVVTKTWKDAINTSEANKIVGFFATEENKKQVFDVMEIEPSLLSQVCSFIDKERILNRKDKISAEFLNKYPKEIILRSIYDEVLSEGNAAVLTTTEDVKKAKPVNEFAEDKLITNEGYRTKYAMNEQDEKLRPGIEVLKAKYFIRDDGKAIELTHDVLTPLIKRDREDRRKSLALATARKRANRRALFIVLFALAVGLLFWYFFTNKAIQDKKEAIKQKKELELQIQKDSASLAVLGKSLDSSRKKLEEFTKRNKKLVGIGDSTFMDSAYSHNDSAYIDVLNKYIRDSVDLAILKIQQVDLVAQKLSLDNLLLSQKKQLENLATTTNEDARKIAEASRENRGLRQTITTETNRANVSEKKYDYLRKSYDSLVKQFDNYIVDVTNIMNPDKLLKELPHIDTNSLHIDLHYNSPKNGNNKVPANLKIYLIPDNNANKKIISNAQIYEIRCDELNLDKAKDRKIAIYRSGVYCFNNVPPGKYFVKICAYYGGYYTYTKKEGNEIIKWDVSPPIR